MRIEVDQITVENVNVVKETIFAALRTGERAFDFSAVRRVDSAALALVLALLRESRHMGVVLELTGLHEGLRSLAELYGVTELLSGAHC